MENNTVNSTVVEFEVVCRKLYQDMFNHAMRLTYQNRARAQDIVQDAMVRAMNAWSTFVPGPDYWASAKAYLYRIVTNTFINEYQARKRWAQALTSNSRDMITGTHQNAQFVDSAGDDASYGFSTATPSFLTLAMQGTMSDEVASAIEGLDQWQRDVVELHYIEGCSYKEISKQLKIPMGTVMSRLSRARATLENKLRVFARDQGYREGVVTAPESGSEVVNTRKNLARLEALEPPQAETYCVQSVVRDDNPATLVW